MATQIESSTLKLHLLLLLLLLLGVVAAHHRSDLITAAPREGTAIKSKSSQRRSRRAAETADLFIALLLSSSLSPQPFSPSSPQLTPGRWRTVTRSDCRAIKVTRWITELNFQFFPICCYFLSSTLCCIFVSEMCFINKVWIDLIQSFQMTHWARSGSQGLPVKVEETPTTWPVGGFKSGLFRVHLQGLVHRSRPYSPEKSQKSSSSRSSRKQPVIWIGLSAAVSICYEVDCLSWLVNLDL